MYYESRQRVLCLNGCGKTLPTHYDLCWQCSFSPAWIAKNRTTRSKDDSQNNPG